MAAAISILLNPTICIYISLENVEYLPPTIVGVAKSQIDLTNVKTNDTSIPFFINGKTTSFNTADPFAPKSTAELIMLLSIFFIKLIRYMILSGAKLIICISIIPYLLYGLSESPKIPYDITPLLPYKIRYERDDTNGGDTNARRIISVKNSFSILFLIEINNDTITDKMQVSIETTTPTYMLFSICCLYFVITFT